MKGHKRCTVCIVRLLYSLVYICIARGSGGIQTYSVERLIGNGIRYDKDKCIKEVLFMVEWHILCGSFCIIFCHGSSYKCVDVV